MTVQGLPPDDRFVIRPDDRPLCHFERSQKRTSADMDGRTIDLTVQVPPQLRVLLVTLGVVHVLGGALFLSGGNELFGILNLVLGPSWLSWGLFYNRINRHAVVIHDEHLTICKGLFRNRRIPWTSILEIRFESTQMEIRVSRGKSATVKLGEMSNSANQTIRQEFVSKIRHFAEANGVSTVGGKQAWPRRSTRRGLF